MRTAAAEAALRDGKGPVWLLTLTLPNGRAIRMASSAITVATRTGGGGPLRFDPFLTGVEDYEEEVDLFALEGVVALTQAQVAFTTPDSLAALQADWHHLCAARVELAMVFDGDLWHERLVLLRGLVQGSSWGRAGEESTLTLESTPEPTSADVGDASRDVGVDFSGAVDTATDAMTDLDGAQYQVVLGKPQSVPAYKVGDVGAAGQNRLILCGHALPNLSAVAVTEDDNASANYTPIVQSSGTGAPYTYVQGATAFLAADGAYTWNAANGGAARVDARSHPTKTAADVVRYLLDTSGIEVDWARSERALQRLASWTIGLYLDEAAPAIDVLREQVLPWLPAFEMPGGEGTWIAYADPHDLPIEAELVMGQNLTGRDGRLEMTDRDLVRNAFSIAYARNEYVGEFTATALIDADTDPLCALSDQLYGTLADGLRECPILWDAVEVRRLGNSYARRFALPRRRLQYLAASDMYWLRAGMGVALTDADLGIPRTRGVIRGMRRVGGIALGIELVDATPMGAL